MPQQLLTDITIRALKPTVSRVDYWDTKIPGFGIRVGPRTKTFIVKQENRRHTIGRYPDLSLSDARAQAKKLMASPPPPASSLTFREAHELFLSTHCANARPRTQRDYDHILRRHFVGPLGRSKLSEITTERVASIINGLTETPMEAFHSFSVCRTLFRWAVSMRYISVSPLNGLRAPRANRPRERVLTATETRSVWNAADAMGYPFGTIVQLCLLTGQRRSEIGALRWEYIDRKERTITLPASLTKNRRNHTFPYGSIIEGILSRLPDKTSAYLFPARGVPGPFNGWSKSKARLDKLCQIAPWTLHDLRRTVATNLAALGVRLEVTEKLLNHISGSFGGIVGVYQKHGFQQEMRAAVEAWEASLSRLIETASV